MTKEQWAIEIREYMVRIQAFNDYLQTPLINDSMIPKDAPKECKKRMNWDEMGDFVQTYIDTYYNETRWYKIMPITIYHNFAKWIEIQENVVMYNEMLYLTD